MRTAQKLNARTVVIGGGASGLMAAAAAGPSCVVLERMPRPGLKILATGGGRCNVTHASTPEACAEQFGEDRRWVRRALSAFPPEAVNRFLNDSGVPTRVESDGCVFPVSGRAQDVLDAILRAVKSAGAEVRCGWTATRIKVVDGVVTGVECRGPDGDCRIDCERVILAAGGRARSALGSDGSGLALASDVGLKVEPPVPALVGLVSSDPWLGELSGVGCEDVEVRLGKTVARGDLLFTHHGISGPAVLEISGEVARAMEPGDHPVTLRIGFVAGESPETWRELLDGGRQRHGAMQVSTFLSRIVPRALARVLCEGASVSTETTLARLRREELLRLSERCGACPVEIVATEGWVHAMMTRGGVALSELNPSTMECRSIRGLFCVGELVDVDAPCGGYNLTWAFASGRLAAQSLDVNRAGRGNDGLQ